MKPVGPPAGVNRACTCASSVIDEDGGCLYCGKPQEAPVVATPVAIAVERIRIANDVAAGRYA